MKYYLVIFFLFVNIGLFGQVFQDEFYENEVLQINNISPENQDYSDFNNLKSKFENAEIIILGERGHGDGASFLAKTRLIQYLTKELDFSTIALEGGGFHEIQYLNFCDTTKQIDFKSQLQNSWYMLWAKSKQVQPFIQFLEKNKKDISIFGMENQAGNNNWSEITLILKEMIGEEVFKRIDSKQFNDNFIAFSSSIYDEDSEFSEANLAQLKGDLNSINNNLNSINNPNTEILIQSIKNIKGFIQQLELAKGGYDDENKSISLRDSLMFENIKWWRERNPNKKLIIWTANFHAIDNLQETIYAEGDDFYQTMQTLGQRLKKEYKNKVYTIAFTSSEGVQGIFSEPTSVEVDESSFEYELSNKTDFEFAFIDFSQLKSREVFQDYRFNASLLGKNRNGKWMDMFDGIFYIRTMSMNEYQNE